MAKKKKAKKRLEPKVRRVQRTGRKSKPAKKKPVKKATGKSVKPKIQVIDFPSLEGFVIVKGASEILIRDEIGLVNFDENLPFHDAHLFATREFAKTFLTHEISRTQESGTLSPFDGCTVKAASKVYGYSYAIEGNGSVNAPFKVTVSIFPKDHTASFATAFKAKKRVVADDLKTVEDHCKVAELDLARASHNRHELAARFKELVELGTGFKGPK